ncbi:DUF421 domain-containing protein [Paenibacillus alginolyticus]|uniref:DUF421 domain-containing protein n=1 Tax=Paenibacillus alginolyticus TaxID=59839 RepID=A0ABT4GB86_9BACL|nr:DUF421 domain-containing protein [Paenibacillus alginolyticus]MCY9666147.1 DUF421 domain-containing protein [Paenibacillus alginolyticus]MCY9693435.1 DUF421 domain-containing protein [Paenibacillus alginolyticus]MEC0148599.1 DUF421 domain-containing protein [Paenibacillus alginolyticus]
MPEWIEIFLKTLLSVVVLFFMTKLLGKRQVSQLSLFEYITGITIGNLAAYISLEKDWYLGLVSLAAWVACSLGIEFLQLKSKKMRDFIDGKGTVLIRDGKVLEDNLKKERLTTDELMEQLRKRSVFKVADVEFAIMEPDGDINVLLARKNQPLTAKHLGIQVAPEQEPQAVIMDGEIMDEALATIGLNRGWLKTELDKLGVTIENVFLGQVDSYSQLYVDLFDDKIMVPVPQEKANLFATLKKCEGDLMLFGLTTNNKAAKEMYEQCSKQMEELIAQLEPVLKR